MSKPPASAHTARNALAAGRARARWAKPLLAAVFALAGASADVLAADPPIRTQSIQFAHGASSAVVEGRIKGYEVIDYLVRARAGQSASISLATKHTATYFNLLAPGQTEAAFFIGSIRGNRYEGALPADGTYHVRVYMMRSAARRNEVANYRLEVAIAGTPTAATPLPSHDAKVPGTDFHATGNVPCTMGGGQPTGSCAFGVQREGQGRAMVVVTRPDGQKRTIFFERGQPTGYDQSQADRGAAFHVRRDGDLSIVHIGNERYEILEAVVNGG